MNTVLEVKNLTKKFNKFTAVDDVSFFVGKGEIVGLLGPNGAGKTTTIQMLLNLMLPTSGEITYFGLPFASHRIEILQRLNHASGYSRLPWRLSVQENLNVYAHLYEVKNYKQKIAELAQIFEINEFINKKFQDLSAGQKTRVLLAKAFLNDPEVVLLDEPTASLDPDIASKIRMYILEERKKRDMSILITSHNMSEVEEMCDRVVFLNHGKVFAIDTPQGLARRNKIAELHLMVTDGLKRIQEYAVAEKIEHKVRNRFIIIYLSEQKIATFLANLAKNKIEYSEIEIVRPSLEDFFLSASKEEAK